MIRFCDSHPAFQLLDTSELALPTRSNTNGDYVQRGMLHHEVLRSILVEQSNWHQALTAIESSILVKDDSQVVCFGSERCVPPSLARRLGSRLIQMADLDMFTQHMPLTQLKSDSRLKPKEDPFDHAVAVVGMSCHVPGAKDLTGFWELLRAGESQHTPVPYHRFGFETAWRDNDPKKKWFGNFLEDHDQFDHKFFRKSPREMESTDPQQRLMLQTAYQAVEQSGYFGLSDQDPRIGCYIGMGTVDYENNIAGYPANAFSATGNLRAFTAGRISHYFGWTGPGLTVDTACSSSAVAIHLACKAIQSGECTAALAGGVSVVTSPEWFQNLAGASFLSPTGQCKPFDAKADGYCRGEGVGAVFLKDLSSAIADGDQVFGVIRGTGVTQNQNCTPITVPNAPSLADLFTNATQKAGLEPQQISVVEAHGTGTPIGDPAEYDGIRRVLGGEARSNPLSLGSVKGLLGHTEYASGVIALVKVLLMIHKGAIPPQPSFQTINPSINASPADKIEIATSLRTWEVDFRAALINNYGASGSNATMVVTQAPNSIMSTGRGTIDRDSKIKYPFRFFGNDNSALRRYAAKLTQYLESETSLAQHAPITDLAFQVSRQSNRTLSYQLVFTCSSANELKEKLMAFLNENGSIAAIPQKSARPIVLCFGGQVSTYVGLDRQVYEGVAILRSHLDQCDAVCQSFGLDSFYPSIFQRSPISDVVSLQTMLFAIQYSCAKSWIDCGLKIAAVVGHSFGELTALCVSGRLSLIDALRTIAGRARIIKNSWGADKGSMMAVEANLEDVKRLLDSSNEACHGNSLATIACYNGPKSFTLAGPTETIDYAARLAVDPAFASMKSKKLNVTNAFHCDLIKPLTADLKKLGQDVTFGEPSIALERATESESTTDLNPQYFADHMSNPVYFNHALQRLSQQYPSCVFLEAGSTSTITAIASRALGSPTSSHFQPINITSDNSLQHLADATANLWKEGINVSFWPHHSMQTSAYTPIFLPPYQFERVKHWMELKKPQKTIPLTADQSQIAESPEGPWIFSGYQDKNERFVRFRINTSDEKFKEHASGHTIAQAGPICPSTYLLYIAIDALTSLLPKSSEYQHHLHKTEMHVPKPIDPSVSVWLDAETKNNDSHVWDWRIVSTNDSDKASETLHMSGQVGFQPINDLSLHDEVATYSRFIDGDRCTHLLNSCDVDDIIQGRNVYKFHAEIMEYGEMYQGLQKIVGKGNESAGRVSKACTGETWLDAGLAECFCQVAGIFVNTMSERPAGEIYLLDRFDRWISFRQSRSDSPRNNIWECYARHRRPSVEECISDVFVYNQGSGELHTIILGIHFQKISKVDIRTMMSGDSSHAKTQEPAASFVPAKPQNSESLEHPDPAGAGQAAESPKAKKKEKSSQPDISASIKDLLCNLSGLEPHEINDSADLVDIGIDSLMGMELAREIEYKFECTLDTAELIELTDFNSLVVCIQRTLGRMDGDEDEKIDGDETRDADSEVKPLKDGGAPEANDATPHVNGDSPSVSDKATLRPETVLAAFEESKQATDRFIRDNKLENYVNIVLPKSTELCVAYIVEAFEKLGCSLGGANPDEKLDRIQYLPQHQQFVDWIYNLLEKHAHLIKIDGSNIWRTAVAPPSQSADVLLQDILREHPEFASDHQLTCLTSAKLAECLLGQADGLQLVFGSAEGRETASAWYSKSPINMVWIKQIEDFLKGLLCRQPTQAEPFRILEMGAGTGGTTARLLPLLADLGVPVEYTVTDISSSLVAAARKRFKQYPFAQFKVLDIEKPPGPDLMHSQHIVLATNCVHATHSLANSTKNIHSLLRSDGFLMMLEMTEKLPFVDIIFGLLEGWWLFDDGRRHALSPASLWENTLRSVGYGHVDWSDGNLPEANIQKVIIALASSPRNEHAETPQKPLLDPFANLEARKAIVDSYIDKYLSSFPPSFPLAENTGAEPAGQCVVITGATGSLGSHLAVHFAAQPKVSMVVCMNRVSGMEATQRQQQAFKSRGISLDTVMQSKIKIWATDTSKPMLGLQSSQYELLVDKVTHIINNAWPMSITRPVSSFEPQFKTMRNLVDLAHQSSCKRPQGSKIGFQLISSIAAVGNYPLAHKPLVPEEGMTMESIPATGYPEAKLVCETILKETLGQDLERFRPMVVRIGQIAGSTTSGYWNPVEHPAFIIKSSQTLRALPDLPGVSTIKTFPSFYILQIHSFVSHY